MSILDTIQNDFKTALKQQKMQELTLLRSLKAAIKNAEIAARKPLTESEIIQILKKNAKQHEESILAFDQAGRQDLAEQERSELALIKHYLPAELSDAELRKKVKDIIDQVGTESGFGVAMGQVMQRLKGQADGNRVRKIVQELLQA